MHTLFRTAARLDLEEQVPCTDKMRGFSTIDALLPSRLLRHASYSYQNIAVAAFTRVMQVARSWWVAPTL